MGELPPDEKFKRKAPKLQVVQQESSQATQDNRPDEVLLTLSQIQQLYGLDDYWVYSLVRKGQIRRYRIFGKRWPVYSEPDIKEVVSAMGKLGRTLRKLRALFAAA